MKIRLLLAFIAVSFASCSSDDNSNPDPSIGIPGEKKLYEIIQRDFNEDGSVMLTTSTSFDENDRAVSVQQYNGDGVLNAHREFTYNGSGQFESMVYYTEETGLDTPNSSYSISYDGEGRVTILNDTFLNNGISATSVTTYTYNQNNTITAIREFSFGGSEITTFYLNTAGLLYKRSNALSTEEITYAGENITTYTSDIFTSEYKYDNAHEPKGQHHNAIINKYWGNRVNAILIEGFTSIDFGTTKYVKQKIDNRGTHYLKYEFDDKGYPIKVRYFLNDASMPYSIREIQYR